MNLDGRRKLFIDYVDIVGPFEPQAAAPESRKKIFVCEQKTAECAQADRGKPGHPRIPQAGHKAGNE